MPLPKYGLLVDVDRTLWELLMLIHKPSKIISHFFLHLSQFLALLVLWVQNQGLLWVKVPTDSCVRPNKPVHLLAFIQWVEQETQVNHIFCQAIQLPLTGEIVTWQWEPLFGSEVNVANTSLRDLRQSSKLILGPPKVILGMWCYMIQTGSSTWLVNTEAQPEGQVIYWSQGGVALLTSMELFRVISRELIFKFWYVLNSTMGEKNEAQSMHSWTWD